VTIEQLKLVIVEEWQKLSRRFINISIDQWRTRLEKLLRTEENALNLISDYIYINISLQFAGFIRQNSPKKIVFTILRGDLTFYGPPCIT